MCLRPAVTLSLTAESVEQGVPLRCDETVQKGQATQVLHELAAAGPDCPDTFGMQHRQLMINRQPAERCTAADPLG